MSMAIETVPVSRGGERSQSTLWFASHEARLIWRDFVGMMTGGRPSRLALVAVIVLTFIAGLHGFAYHLLSPVLDGGITATKQTFLFLTGGVVMFFSLMFSQAIESVTRAYYSRSDLDLILSSPAPVRRLFEVRSGVLTLQTIALSVLIASPTLNVLIAFDGWQWLAGYLVLACLGGVATSFAVLVTLLLFRLVGTARTRLIAQIIAAVVGAGFVIALQACAILFGKGITRFSLFTSSETVAGAPEVSSWFWLPAKAVMGSPAPLLLLVALSGLFLFCVIVFSARRFATDVLATAGASERRVEASAFIGFRKNAGLRAGLRRKEWMLLRRDPWLISQTLQQILYLLPPALLLWMNYGEGSGIFYVVVPVIVMAAGQLAGGLSWLTISGEDAHELIDTAPVPARTLLRAKVEAVLLVIAAVLAPFAVGLALYSIQAAIWMLVGGALAASSAVLIQIWFRSQANRSLFRRRQVSSRAATICEALVSILWAAGAGLALLHWILIVIPAVLVSVVLLIAWFVRPRG